MLIVRNPYHRSVLSHPCRKALTAIAIASVAGAGIGVGGPAAAAPAAPAGAQATCGSAAPTAPALTATPNVLPANATSTVTVRGSRFMVPPHPAGADVFGGVYVFFGWVAPGGQWGPGWRGRVPSNPYAGLFGATYAYPGEDAGAETRDDGSGTVRLVSFTAGGLSGSETAYHMDCDGNWQTTVTVRGATFQWRDHLTGASSTIDCRVVQCGILTIGAHGKASQTNEVFTPITFTSPPATSGGSPTPVPGGEQTPTPGGAGNPGPSQPASGGGSRPSNPSRGTPTTQQPSSSAATTTTIAAADTSTTTSVVDDSTTTTAPTTTARPRRERGDEAAAPAVIDDGDGASSALVIGGVAGAAAAAALAGGFVWRRRRETTSA